MSRKWTSKTSAASRATPRSSVSRTDRLSRRLARDWRILTGGDNRRAEQPIRSRRVDRLAAALGRQETVPKMSKSPSTVSTGSLCFSRPTAGRIGSTLNAIVRAYRQECRPRLEAQLRSFADEPSLPSAVSRAALAQTPDKKRYSHQTRIKKTVLEESRRRLLDLDLAEIRQFEELRAAVERTVDPIRGAGDLFVYDTALRIGAKLGVMPDRVYLHRGTRRGARALGLPWKERSISVSNLPIPLRSLPPHEVEDCLCIFKDQFK